MKDFGTKTKVLYIYYVPDDQSMALNIQQKKLQHENESPMIMG